MEQDFVKAIGWLERAAAEGSAEAETQLGNFAEAGLGQLGSHAATCAQRSPRCERLTHWAIVVL